MPSNAYNRDLTALRAPVLSTDEFLWDIAAGRNIDEGGVIITVVVPGNFWHRICFNLPKHYEVRLTTAEFRQLQGCVLNSVDTARQSVVSYRFNMELDKIFMKDSDPWVCVAMREVLPYAWALMSQETEPPCTKGVAESLSLINVGLWAYLTWTKRKSLRMRIWRYSRYLHLIAAIGCLSARRPVKPYAYKTRVLPARKAMLVDSVDAPPAQELKVEAKTPVQHDGEGQASQNHETPPERSETDLPRVSDDPRCHRVYGCESRGQVARLDTNAPKETDDPHNRVVRGALVLPSTHSPRVDCDTVENVIDAVNGRLIKNERPFKLEKGEVAKIDKFIESLIWGYNVGGKMPKTVGALFTNEMIDDWLRQMDLYELRSGQWSETRFEAAINKLYAQYLPGITYKASIKAEAMPDGKAPRLLIADGDLGQIMSVMTIACIEHILFNAYESRSIKHASKDLAIDRVVASTRASTSAAARHEFTTVEGDGSSWDATCRDKIRNRVECPVVKRVSERIAAVCGIFPEIWHREHYMACCADTVELHKHPRKGTSAPPMRLVIPAIRRSGHRGTSVLNWLVNFTMWSCAVAAEPQQLLDPACRFVKNVVGKKSWIAYAFEGDDSLVNMSGLTPALEKRILDFWLRAGFVMKLKLRRAGDKAEFCGCWIYCDNQGPTLDWSPDLPRAIRNSGLSCSVAAVKAAKEDDLNTLRNIAASKALAYANSFAAKVPTFSRKMIEYAASMNVEKLDVRLDREVAWKLGALAEDPTSNDTKKDILTSDIVATIQAKHTTAEEERLLLSKLGWAATDDEIERFTASHWDFDQLKDFEKHAESIPAKWRQ